MASRNGYMKHVAVRYLVKSPSHLSKLKMVLTSIKFAPTFKKKKKVIIVIGFDNDILIRLID